mmetsp:Transcript_22065/g.52751  ORF Transcript_22065/g.52751 Transcript_22065/m.52751 type:complete len:307 (-) Transcript_22065:494-1414(-)
MKPNPEILCGETEPRRKNTAPGMRHQEHSLSFAVACLFYEHLGGPALPLAGDSPSLEPANAVKSSRTLSRRRPMVSTESSSRSSRCSHPLRAAPSAKPLPEAAASSCSCASILTRRCSIRGPAPGALCPSDGGRRSAPKLPSAGPPASPEGPAPSPGTGAPAPGRRRGAASMDRRQPSGAAGGRPPAAPRSAAGEGPGPPGSWPAKNESRMPRTPSICEDGASAGCGGGPAAARLGCGPARLAALPLRSQRPLTRSLSLSPRMESIRSLSSWGAASGSRGTVMRLNWEAAPAPRPSSTGVPLAVRR